MRRRLLTALLTAAAVLLLCACQQSSAIARQLDGYKDIIESSVGPIPTVTPEPSATPKPSYIPKITATPKPTPSPSPTPRPEPSLFPMPTPTASPSPTPEATASPEPSITPAPLPSYAPIPQSVPFALPTPEPTAAPAPEQTQPESGGGGESQESDSPTVNVPSGTYATGQQVAEYALQYVGYNYLYGGKSPDTGFDCSGFVYYVYQQFGYTMNRIASDQAANGVHVEHDALEPGDVLCFYNSGTYIGHSGIYIGGGEYVHAESSATGVVVSPLSTRGDRYEARRIL